MVALSNQNFKIESKDRKVEEGNAIVNGKKVQIQIKINSHGDVWEYVSGVPAAFVGQQLFTYAAALRETQKAGKSLPEDQDALHQAITAMKGDTEHQQYQNYLTTTKVQFAGCYSSGLHTFDDIGLRAYYRLADGTRLALNATTWSVARRDETMGYAVRLND